MPVPDREERTLASGPFCTVEYAVSENETLEAKEWFDVQPDKIRASFGVLFERLVSEGMISNKTQFRCLGGDVYEFKRSTHRLLCYHHGNRWLLTHRFKKGEKLKKEIRKANRIGTEHIQWELEHEE